MSNFPRRGIRLPSCKEPAASRAMENIRTLHTLLLPLSGDEGARSVLREGDVVRRGQPLQATGPLPARATTNGIFKGVRPVTHPLYGTRRCAVIAYQKTNEPSAAHPAKNAGTLSPAQIEQAARQAGIVDELDGTPLADKLADWRDNGCERLVADATQAEPYASSAWAVLREDAEAVWNGLQLAARAINASGSHIAVQLPRDKQRLLAEKLGHGALFCAGARYPVASLTRTESRMPSAGTRPSVARIGVQACLALQRAVVYGEWPDTGVLTVAGSAVANPCNLRVPFGTLLSDVLEHVGLPTDPGRVVVGDAMTGVAAASLDIPVLPGVTCVLAFAPAKVPVPKPCTGCGRCVQVCHAGLMPCEIVRRLENMHYERLAALHPEECDGCGACSYICPSARDMTARVLEAQQTHGTILLDWGNEDDA